MCRATGPYDYCTLESRSITKLKLCSSHQDRDSSATSHPPSPAESPNNATSLRFVGVLRTRMLAAPSYIYMPENLYPKLPSAPSISQESFNIQMIRKYHQDIMDLKNKYHKKQRKYKNSYNKLLHASTGASSVGVISGAESTIGKAFTVVGLSTSASLGVMSTVSTCVGGILLLSSQKYITGTLAFITCLISANFH